jgi:hypothetical protein
MNLITRTLYEKIELTKEEQEVIQKILDVAESYDFQDWDFVNCLRDLAYDGTWEAKDYDFI